jgi:cysteine desulfurase
VAGSVGTVYLDGSSGEPLLPEARAAWQASQEAGWGDPLRLHRPGRLAAQALDRAREVVAAAVGARPDEVVFTGSGVQSAYAAVAGLALGRRRVGASIVTSAIEHSSILAAAAAYGSPVSVPVDRTGRVELEVWGTAIGAGVAAACLQVANHEVGTLQPYGMAAEACAAGGVPLVLDATAALGRLDLTGVLPWAVLIGSAAAFGGPPSVGFLVIRRSARWRAPYPVDDYQGGRWPGPPDVPGIVAATVALEVWLDSREPVAAFQHELIAHLRGAVSARVSDVDVVGDPEARAPHLLTCSVLYVDGETLTLELDRAGFAVSSGSACSSNSQTPSHVLAAMGALTHGNLRIGLTRTTTRVEVDAFVDALIPTVARIRETLGAP